jgi:hypothetical protein
MLALRLHDTEPLLRLAKTTVRMNGLGAINAADLPHMAFGESSVMS